jgi:hypothetical protein
MTAMEFQKNRHYVFAEDGKAYFHPYTPWAHQEILPNLEEIIEPADALFQIAVTNALDDAPYNLAFKMPGEHYATYCKVFLRSTPMGSRKSWDGSGVLLTMHNSTKPRVFKFALCKHEKTEEGHRPNQGRGWHPGHCKHCGMDLTVDSGD